MRLALVGIGGAGGRIASAVRSAERTTGSTLTDGEILVFDTDRDDLAALGGIPDERRILIGDTYDAVEGTGVDGDPELATEAARTDDYEIQRSFDDVPIEDLDGILVVAGLAGGTGGGAGAAITEMCGELFDLPVYAIGVLPSVDEGDSAALTAARSLASFVRLADNVFPFDNETWATDADDDFEDVNTELATRIVSVLSLGEFDGSPAEARVDRTDIIRTLSTGGVSSIGMASVSLDLGWRRWVRWCPWVSVPSRDGSDALRLKNLIRRAVDSRLTLPCEVESTERALVVTSGPPELLSRKGFESARYWLEDELDTVEIIAGDEPRPRSTELTAMVVLSNVTDVPRIEELKEQAVMVVEPEA